MGAGSPIKVSDDGRMYVPRGLQVTLVMSAIAIVGMWGTSMYQGSGTVNVTATGVDEAVKKSFVPIQKSVDMIQSNVQALTDAQSAHTQIPMHSGATERFIVDEYQIDLLNGNLELALEAHEEVTAQLTEIRSQTKEEIESVKETSDQILSLLIEKVIEPAEAAAEGASP